MTIMISPNAKSKMANQKKACQESSKKLSKNLLLMKFMKRTAVKAELEEVNDEKRRIENEEHWELDIPELQKAEDKYVIEPSYSVLQNLWYGRMSFKGFNPEIETIMRAENVSMELDEAERREKEIAVSDDEMAERYKWLGSSMGKKYATKRQRAEMQSSDDEGSPVEIESKRHRAGHMPHGKKTDFQSHELPSSSSAAGKPGRKLIKNMPKGEGKKWVPEACSPDINSYMPVSVPVRTPNVQNPQSKGKKQEQKRKEGKKQVPEACSPNINSNMPVPVPVRTPNVQDPQSKGKKQEQKRKHVGPVMDSDEEDEAGDTRRKRRRGKFLKPKD